MQAWMAQPREMEIMHLCFSGEPGLWGIASKTEICRAVWAWGHVLVEIMNVCGSPALRALLREIMV
jgi:hypothetical protein